MRVISKRMLREFWETHPDSRAALDDWHDAAKRAGWRSIADVRQSFPHADGVRVDSGKTVTVFNICGNKYRLITSIGYAWGVVYTLRVLTHTEYSKDRWKESL